MSTCKKFAEDGGNVCEGQEQNSSCFRSITELDQRRRSDKYTRAQNLKLGQCRGPTLRKI